MRAFVHFSIGVSGMLLILLFLDLDHRHEFLLMFASGLWAVVPDLGWLLLRIDIPMAAGLWKSIFNSPGGNLFWFHPLIDANEPDNRVIEMTGGFVILGLGVTIFYFCNDWESDRACETQQPVPLDDLPGNQE